ncbi:unnamed protein product [Pedinophyceae sp. YPF-701]|nr:unnamed protein product [Pedinophyceae sp. YPF-701]
MPGMLRQKLPKKALSSKALGSNKAGATSAGRGQPKPKMSNPRTQPGAAGRKKDRLVALPGSDETHDMRAHSVERERIFFEDGTEIAAPEMRGRVMVYCTAEEFDMKELQKRHREIYNASTLTVYPELLHGGLSAERVGGAVADVFYFDYGVVVFWGLVHEEEMEILDRVVRPNSIDPLLSKDIEVDEFEYVYSVTERPKVQNDVITLSVSMAGDATVKISIAHALAQSLKLCIYEKRVSLMASESKHLPETLAESGSVGISSLEIHKLIGELFIHRSAVNLLSTVLDTPEFFWDVPDALQGLYRKVCEYLELDTRVEILNARCQVLGDLLQILRDQQNFAHGSRLEWIVIWLIVIECFVGLLEVASMLGWIDSAG